MVFVRLTTLDNVVVGVWNECLVARNVVGLHDLGDIVWVITIGIRLSCSGSSSLLVASNLGRLVLALGIVVQTNGILSDLNLLVHFQGNDFFMVDFVGVWVINERWCFLF